MSDKPQPAFDLVNSSLIYSWGGRPVFLDVEVKGLRFFAQPAEPLYMDFLLGDVKHRLIAQTDPEGEEPHVIWMGHCPEDDDFWVQLDMVSLPKGHPTLQFLRVDGKPLSQHKP
jgi:hypothetical protein